MESDGISLNEKTELTKQKKEIEQIFDIVTIQGEEAVVKGQDYTEHLMTPRNKGKAGRINLVSEPDIAKKAFSITAFGYKII